MRRRPVAWVVCLAALAAGCGRKQERSIQPTGPSTKAVAEHGADLQAGKTVSFISPHDLGDRILDSLRANSPESFRRLIPTESDISEVAKLLPEDDRAEFVKVAKQEFIRPFNEAVSANYKSVLQKGASYGIDWSKIGPLSVVYEEQIDPDFELTFANTIYYVFTFMGHDYRLVVGDCIKGPNGWAVYDSIHLEEHTD